MGYPVSFKKNWSRFCRCKSCVRIFIQLFSEGLEYRTINGYRSAISVYHEKAEGIPIAQHPKVCQLLSGIFNKRPPQTKYTVIWDSSKVIDYKFLSGNKEKYKIITLKLTTLWLFFHQTEPQNKLIWTLGILCLRKTQSSFILIN